MNKAIVKKVKKDSIASLVNITEGDILLSINSKSMIDIFDYMMLIQDEELLLTIQKPSGDIWEIEIDKDEDEDLGITFTEELIDGEKSCNNKCIFCFIDQLPKGMRETLYFKDDDSRLSFLTGNYVTLTNMPMKELERIAKLRLSPINISVHTTNPELRKAMLNNRFAGDVMEKIEYLISQGISINTQIVLCKDVNDGIELDRSILELSELYPNIESLSVVPVGLSKHREGLAKLEPFSKEDAIDIVNQIEKYQKKSYKKNNNRFVYIADEFYLTADKEIPDSSYYDGFPQIENGVGLLASMRDEIKDCLENTNYIENKRDITIATGALAYPFIVKMCQKIMKKYDKIKIHIIKVDNEFFGHKVTVVGLLTGSDILRELQNHKISSELLIARSMLKADMDIFLDNVTIRDIEEKFKTTVIPVLNEGHDFIKKIVEGVVNG